MSRKRDDLLYLARVENEAFERLVQDPNGVSSVETSVLFIAFEKAREELFKEPERFFGPPSLEEERLTLIETLYLRLRGEIDSRIKRGRMIGDEW